jgi:hypothetical protein
MHFCFRQDLQIGFSAFPSEEDVILTPKDDRLWLLLLEKGLPLRIERNIRAVVVKEIQLDSPAVWLLDGREEV